MSLNLNKDYVDEDYEIDVDEIDVVLDIPEQMYSVFEGDFRYRVAFGGRGSTKSWTFARMMILSAIQEQEPVVYLCARELHKSIKDSVHKLLVNQIKLMGLEEYFHWGKSFLICKNGVNFAFFGLRHNAEEIKSLEGVKIAWIEEGQKTSATSWKILDPTIRMDNSEIWVSFNPEDEKDPTYQMFVVNTPPNAKVVKVNWYHNPWFTKVLEDQRSHMQRTDPDAYSHVWEGNFLTRTDAQVLGGKWIVDVFEPDLSSGEWLGPYDGADWGFSQDPTVLVRCWIREYKDELSRSCRDLYIEKEAWGLRVENDDIPELFDGVDGSRKSVIRADCARPETINHVKKFGFNIVAASKWAGSVEDGISYLRSFNQIIIHPDCPRTAEEARLYTHKIDKLTEDILSDIVDKWNHCIDAIRYALQPMIKVYSMGFKEGDVEKMTKIAKTTTAPKMESVEW